MSQTFATEGGHWYASDGTPVYEVQAAKGGMRPTTLRDARKLNLYPSVTAICGSASNPGLDAYKRRQLLESAYTAPAEIAGLPFEDWAKAVQADADQHALEARDRGTAIHAEVEQGFRDGIGGAYYSAAASALWGAFGSQPWAEERSFACEAGYGGKVDLHAPGFVVDFKTTDDLEKAKRPVDSYVWQLAAYRHGLGMPDARCALVYLHRDKAEARMVEVEEGDLRAGWAVFEALLNLWQTIRGYTPRARRDCDA